MLKIRLARTGKKNFPSFRIVVKEARSKRDGKAVDCLGYYDPKTDPPTIKVDKKKLEEYLKQGAQMTKIVSQLINKQA